MKTKKATKDTAVKKMTEEEAHDIGLNSEQAMANLICSKIPETDGESLDAAFLSSFQSLTYRMLQFWKKDMLLDIVNDISQNVDQEGVHVCDDCKEKHEVSKEDRNKLH